MSIVDDVNEAGGLANMWRESKALEKVAQVLTIIPVVYSLFTLDVITFLFLLPVLVVIYRLAFVRGVTEMYGRQMEAGGEPDPGPAPGGPGQQPPEEPRRRGSLGDYR